MNCNPLARLRPPCCLPSDAERACGLSPESSPKSHPGGAH